MTDVEAAPERSTLLRWGRRAWAVVGIVLAAVAVYLGMSMISGLVVPLVIALVVGALFAGAALSAIVVKIVERFRALGTAPGDTAEP